MHTANPAPGDDKSSRGLRQFQLPTIVNCDAPIDSRKASLAVVDSKLRTDRISGIDIDEVVASLRRALDLEEGNFKYELMKTLSACSFRNEEAKRFVISALETPGVDERRVEAVADGLFDARSVFCDTQLSRALGICIEKGSEALVIKIVNGLLDILKLATTETFHAEERFTVSNNDAVLARLESLTFPAAPIDARPLFKNLVTGSIAEARRLQRVALDSALEAYSVHLSSVPLTVEATSKCEELRQFLLSKAMAPAQLLAQCLIDGGAHILAYNPLDQAQEVDSLSRLLIELSDVATRIPGRLAVAVPFTDPKGKSLRSLLSVSNGILTVQGDVEEEDEYKALVLERTVRFLEGLLANSLIDVIWYGVDGDREPGTGQDDLIITLQAAPIRNFITRDRNNKLILIGGAYACRHFPELRTLYDALSEIGRGSIWSIFEHNVSDLYDHEWFRGASQNYGELKDRLANVPDAGFEVAASPFAGTQLERDVFDKIWKAAIFRSKREPPDEADSSVEPNLPTSAKPVLATSP